MLHTRCTLFNYQAWAFSIQSILNLTYLSFINLIFEGKNWQLIKMSAFNISFKYLHPNIFVPVFITHVIYRWFPQVNVLFIINQLLTRLVRLRLPIKLRNIPWFIKFYFRGSAGSFFPKRAYMCQTIKLIFHFLQGSWLALWIKGVQ